MKGKKKKKRVKIAKAVMDRLNVEAWKKMADSAIRDNPRLKTEKIYE